MGDVGTLEGQFWNKLPWRTCLSNLLLEKQHVLAKEGRITPSLLIEVWMSLHKYYLAFRICDLLWF